MLEVKAFAFHRGMPPATATELPKVATNPTPAGSIAAGPAGLPAA